MAKKALVVGIDAYDPPNALPSCIKDADSFEALLRSRYAFETVATLRDRQASKAAILGGLQTLLTGAKAGDTLVFYFSGHGYSFQKGGTQVEALVPQDADFLTSAEVAETTKDAPPGTLTFVLDSCYSGGLQKLFVPVGDGVKPAKVKFWTPPHGELAKAFAPGLAPISFFHGFGEGPVPIFLSQLIAPAVEGAKAFSLLPPPIPGVDRHFILLSACKNDETAAASTDRTDGRSAFTFSLLDQIGKSQPDLGVDRVVDAAGRELRQLGLGQTPMLKVPADPPRLADHPFLLWDHPIAEAPGTTPSDLGAITTLVSPPSKGLNMTSSLTLDSKTGFDKDWLSDLTNIIQTVTPLVASALKDYQPPSKGFVPPAQPSIDKGFFDDLTHVIAAVVPALVQGLKDFQPPSKGFAPGPIQPFDKGWFDSITSIVAAVVPEVVSALKGFQKPGGTLTPLADAAQKGWFDDVTHVVASVLPVIISATKDLKIDGVPGSKGFQPAADDKNWLSVLGNIAKVAVPIALSIL